MRGITFVFLAALIVALCAGGVYIVRERTQARLEDMRP